MSINSFIYALKLELFLVCDILFKANILHFCTKNDNVRAGPAMLEIKIAKVWILKEVPSEKCNSE